MKNLEIFELSIEKNNGWRARNIKIEKASNEDMFDVVSADLYNVYVFTNDNELTVNESDAVLAADGINIKGLEFAGENGRIAEENGYSRCFIYVGDGSEKSFIDGDNDDEVACCADFQDEGLGDFADNF